MCSPPAGIRPELEGDAAVSARLADRARRERVEGDALQPAGLEHQRRLADLLRRADVKRDSKKRPLAQPLGRVDVEGCDRTLGGGRLRSLPEEVRETQKTEDAEER